MESVLDLHPGSNDDGMSSFHPEQKLAMVHGQGLVAAWYLAMHKALTGYDQDEEHARQLWDCGMSVTMRVQVFSQSTPLQGQIAAMKASERFHSAGQLTDDFITFTQRLHLAMTEDATHKAPFNVLDAGRFMEQHGLYYRGTPASKTLLNACKLVVEQIRVNQMFSNILGVWRWNHHLWMSLQVTTRLLELGKR